MSDKHAISLYIVAESIEAAADPDKRIIFDSIESAEEYIDSEGGEMFTVQAVMDMDTLDHADDEPVGLTPEEEAELADTEAAFEEAGGRGVDLAERIDELRRKRDGE
jgi:hypothetical protein